MASFQMPDLDPTAIASASRAERKRLAQIWARRVGDQIGPDPASLEGAPNGYDHRLKPIVASLVKTIDKVSASIFLNALAESVQAQRAILDYLYEVAKPPKKDDALKAPALRAGFDTSIDLSSLIDFLKGPLVPDTISEFSRRTSLDAPAATDFYHAFWDLPSALRAAAWSKHLAEPRFGGLKVALTQIATSPLVSDFLPADKGPNSAFDIGRIIAQGIVRTAKPAIAGQIVAAALHAVREDATDQLAPEPLGQDADERFGFRLGSFLGCLGGGALKIAQYAHSLPNLPIAWIKGLAASKTEAEPDTRHDFFYRIFSFIPHEILKHVQRIGAYKGTGAYVGTYGVELEDHYRHTHDDYRHIPPDWPLVVSALKLNIGDDALHFVDYLLDLGSEIATFSPEAHKSIAPLLAIVAQGRRMVLQETDMTFSKAQEQKAAEFFDHLAIDVEDTSFRFYTQNAFDCGEHFRFSREVLGPHFNQLPFVTQEEKFFVRKSAIALFTSSLKMDLSGGPLNHDMHGDNNGIYPKGNTVWIGLFDSGALDVTPPTPEQQRTAADILFNAFVNAKKNDFGLESSLRHTIAKATAHLTDQGSDALDYINNILRSVLSKGDYIKRMRGSDFRAAAIALVFSRSITGNIVKRLFSRAGSLICLKADDLTNKIRRNPSLRFEADQRAIYFPRNPRKALPARSPSSTTAASQGSGLRREVVGPKRLRVRIGTAKARLHL